MKAIKNRYTFRVRILNGLFITGILFIFLSSCESKNTANTRLQSQVFEEKPIDTTVVKYFSFPDFQFYIKKTKHPGNDEEQWFCMVHINKSNKNIFLFDTSLHYENAELRNIFGAYYIWPFWDGGNGHWSVGETVFKITSDSAFVIGKVSRYDDITGDSIPELFTWELIEYGSVRAHDKFENRIVMIENDSLSYRYPN